MSKIYHKRKSQLGKVFVKYSEPIDLESFILEHDGQQISTNLTKTLYKIH
jgi:glycerol-3-phosphate O-acyltransferase